MNYLKEYGISAEKINELREIYNENIIKFLSNNEIFIKEKLEYLKKEDYIIYPILRYNIKIFLEGMPELKRKVENMKQKGFNKKHIQMIMLDINRYNNY